MEGASPRGAIHIIRQLGVLGLYKGASACLLRDIPFSAIYFPAYGHLKQDVFREGYNGKKLSFLETLAAAGIAYVTCYHLCLETDHFSGMPAAYLTTPAGVWNTALFELAADTMIIRCCEDKATSGSQEGPDELPRFGRCFRKNM